MIYNFYDEDGIVCHSWDYLGYKITVKKDRTKSPVTINKCEVIFCGNVIWSDEIITYDPIKLRLILSTWLKHTTDVALSFLEDA